jgi:hypothetical protein
MSSNTQKSQNAIAIRNYLLALGSVVFLGMGLADTYNQPSRAAQQYRLDNYGRFVGIGLITYSQKVFPVK